MGPSLAELSNLIYQQVNRHLQRCSCPPKSNANNGRFSYSPAMRLIGTPLEDGPGQLLGSSMVTSIEIFDLQYDDAPVGGTVPCLTVRQATEFPPVPYQASISNRTPKP